MTVKDRGVCLLISGIRIETLAIDEIFWLMWQEWCMASQLGAEVLMTRTRDLQLWRDGQLAPGQEMAGRRIVAQVDGGRVRIRTQIETTKRKGVKSRRKIRVEWREPKLLIIYLSDGKGRMVKGTRPRIDGTLKGADHLMELLAFHLHRLGAGQAKTVSFISDGASWIWNRLDWVVGRAGLAPKRVERILDCCHATHHISLALQALGLAEDERTATYAKLRQQLRAGRSREVVATLRKMAEGQPVDSSVWTEIEYLNKHEAHLRYDWFEYRGRPRGSGGGGERDPSGDQLASEGERDLLEVGERGGDAGAESGGVDGSLGRAVG